MNSHRLKECRELSGLTQRELSNLAGLSLPSVRAYEQGVRKPKIETWQKLADALGVSVPYLQGLSNNRYGFDQSQQLTNSLSSTKAALTEIDKATTKREKEEQILKALDAANDIGYADSVNAWRVQTSLKDILKELPEMYSFNNDTKISASSDFPKGGSWAIYHRLNKVLNDAINEVQDVIDGLK